MRLHGLLLGCLLGGMTAGCTGTEETDDSERPPKDGRNDDTGTTDTEDTEPPPFEPDAGTYVVDNATTTQDSCGVDQEGGGPGGPETFTIAAVAAAAFKITVDIDGTQSDPFDCTYDQRQKYNCPNSDVRVPIDEVDATLIITLSASGTFDTTASLTGVQGSVTNCDGGDCGLVEAYQDISFPCLYDRDVTAHLQPE